MMKKKRDLVSMVLHFLLLLATTAQYISSTEIVNYEPYSILKRSVILGKKWEVNLVNIILFIGGTCWAF